MNISVAAELMMPDLGLSKTSDGTSVHQVSGGIRDVPSSRREIGGCVWPENRFDLAAVIWARPPCGSSLLCGARVLGDGGPSLAGQCRGGFWNHEPSGHSGWRCFDFHHPCDRQPFRMAASPSFRSHGGHRIYQRMARAWTQEAVGR